MSAPAAIAVEPAQDAAAPSPQGPNPSGPRRAPAPRLAVEDLVVRYGERRALDGLSFEARPGEVLGVLGPNGAGKTTAFRVLCGLVRPDAGAIRIDGSPTRPEDPAYRRALGVVFQEPSLDEKLTARENLRLAGALYGVARATREGRVAALLAFVELADRADERVERYSGGMKRRVEIARALLHHPRLLLMDEPTSGLDEAAARKLWTWLDRARRDDGVTVVVSTHRPDEADRCDRVAILDAGRTVACDTPEALRRHVGGDVITLEADDPGALAAEVELRFGVGAAAADGRVTVERRDAHELVPRLVEAFPAGRLRSVSIRRPSLADVFVKLTGHAFRVARSSTARGESP